MKVHDPVSMAEWLSGCGPLMTGLGKTHHSVWLISGMDLASGDCTTGIPLLASGLIALIEAWGTTFINTWKVVGFRFLCNLL